mmetsp:Transcript_42321/g.135506  ORF Transcript_42321/g.135506 Transcript_42321/m.135506 type:complete len:256 (-) Transcript_42321:263-1030(-)
MPALRDEARRQRDGGGPLPRPGPRPVRGGRAGRGHRGQRGAFRGLRGLSLRAERGHGVARPAHDLLLWPPPPGVCRRGGSCRGAARQGPGLPPGGVRAVPPGVPWGPRHGGAVAGLPAGGGRVRPPGQGGGEARGARAVRGVPAAAGVLALGRAGRARVPPPRALVRGGMPAPPGGVWGGLDGAGTRRGRRGRRPGPCHGHGVRHDRRLAAVGGAPGAGVRDPAQPCVVRMGARGACGAGVLGRLGVLLPRPQAL